MNARDFTPVPVGKVAPKPNTPRPPPVLEFSRAQPCYEGMDDTADYAMTTARFDRLTDDQIEQLTDEADLAASKEQLEDVKADMRSEWERARFWAGGLNLPKLPIVAGGKLALLSFPEVLALCGETNHLYVLLADVFRGASPDTLQMHLRDVWIEGYCQELANIGWSA